MIKRMNIFVQIITLGWPRAITLAPFGIYIQEEHLYNEHIRRHELVHWNQQIEMFILPFYLWYFLEWIVKLFIYGNKAYYSLSFEREARAGRTERFGWIKYL